MTAAFACTWNAAEAGLLSGSSVTGELYFGSDFSNNLFYPPTASCALNSGSTTVTISESATEFCYFLNGYIAVDFDETTPQLTVIFNTVPVGTRFLLSRYI